MVTGALLLAGCKAEPEKSGCTADSDCKGDRICEAGQCVAPPSPGAAPAPSGSPLSSPAPTAPPQQDVNAAAADAEAPAPSALEAATGEPKGPPLDRSRALATAPTLGANRPDVVITMFAGLECPFSAKATGLIRAILERHGKPDGRVRVEYRHLPLMAQPRGEALAVASVAAHLQGRFWRFHDALVRNPGRTDESDVVAFAKVAGADIGAWALDRQSPDVAARVKSDQAIAQSLGVSATPTFFVNGKKVEGLVEFDVLESLVTAELAAADALAPTPPGAVDVPAFDVLTRKNAPDFARFVLDGAPTELRPPPARPVDPTVWKVPVASDAPTLGPADALVTMVFFADFECPFSAKLLPVLEALQHEREADVRLVFAHSPLAVHPKARDAAEIGVAAQAGGKFWDYAHKVYGRPEGKPLDQGDLVAAAGELGIGGGQLVEALGQGRYRARVEDDQSVASRVEAIGTPNLFVNGRKVVGVRPADELRALVDEELEKARARVTGGVERARVYDAIISAGVERQALSGEVLSFDLTNSPTTGEPTGAAHIVLFTDFQCPFSARLVPILDRAMKSFAGRIRLSVKHFPQDFHPEAVALARIGACAQEQGRFWEVFRQFMDLEKQKSLGPDSRKAWLIEAGIDEEKLAQCLASKRPDAVLETDAEDAKVAAIKGTPTLFINGRRFSSPTGYNDRSLGRVLASVAGPPIIEPVVVPASPAPAPPPGAKVVAPEPSPRAAPAP
ncbi:MAG: thioredoxin domain-containing protein [Myxococcales bacterium]|nr:thioredoxin domain-containing protein [Myxococcales bacterium]